MAHDDLFCDTMCGILFYAQLGKTPDTESEEFVDFLNRLRDSNARRGEQPPRLFFNRALIGGRILKAQMSSNSLMRQSKEAATGMTYTYTFLPQNSN